MLFFIFNNAWKCWFIIGCLCLLHGLSGCVLHDGTLVDMLPRIKSLEIRLRVMF